MSVGSHPERVHARMGFRLPSVANSEGCEGCWLTSRRAGSASSSEDLLARRLRVATRVMSIALACAVPTFALAGGSGHSASGERTPASQALPKAHHEAPFLAANDAAMTKMMNGMSVRPSGDIDHDFVAMMVPHHQGAIDMAVAELRYGHNERLRRLAQEIIVTQQQEIAAMRLAIGEPLPPSHASPTQPPPVSDH